MLFIFSIYEEKHIWQHVEGLRLKRFFRRSHYFPSRSVSFNGLHAICSKDFVSARRAFVLPEMPFFTDTI